MMYVSEYKLVFLYAISKSDLGIKNQDVAADNRLITGIWCMPSFGEGCAQFQKIQKIFGSFNFQMTDISKQLGSVAGPVIHEDGRLTFEADMSPGGLLYFTTQ